MIELTLPYPPSVNHYKTIGRIQRTSKGKLYQTRINSNETKRYYFEVWFLIQHLKAKEGLKSFDDATIAVEVDVYPPDYRKRDVDGILKVLLDSMQRAGLYDDDYQITKLVVERKCIVKGGQIIVRIASIS
jgi:crossover junction endodeoxyribonuclease RusA